MFSYASCSYFVMTISFSLKLNKLFELKIQKNKSFRKIKNCIDDFSNRLFNYNDKINNMLNNKISI